METIRTCLDAGGKVLICGNGGSAAQADHFMAEMIGSGLACVSLTNPAVITALANDYIYDVIFIRQIIALGKPGDVVILLSTSGTSPNIMLVEELVPRKGFQIIILPNQTQEEYKDMDTQEIQHLHQKILHQIWKGLYDGTLDKNI